MTIYRSSTPSGRLAVLSPSIHEPLGRNGKRATGFPVFRDVLKEKKEPVQSSIL
jgi:hypothetical protein